MSVCNISFQIEPSAEAIWKAWMQEQFIPNCMQTDCFNSFQFYELEVEPSQAPTYTLQLFAISKEAMETYRGKHAADLLYKLHHTWGEQCFHFSSFMQIVN